ncbi:MAG: hypothetical protein U1F35_05465 [Steroidobacteraceae bacterium]
MTIEATASEISYSGNGVTVAFGIPFPFDTAADIKVTATDASGTAAEIVSGFAITGGGGSTGTCTFTTAPATGVTITILDDPDFTQPTDYTDNDAFPAETHERALDRVTRLCKRLLQLVGRSLRFPDGDPSSSVVLGSVDTRKGKYLFFNAVTGAIEYAVGIAVTTLTQSILGQLLNPQTDEEVAAGVVPTNYWYQPGDFRRYGAKQDGTDQYAILQKALDIALYSSGRVMPSYVAAGPGFYHSQTLQLRANGRLYGAGLNNSFLVYTGLGDALQINGTAVNVNTRHFGTVEDLGITHTQGASNNGAGIVVFAASLVNIRRCNVYNFKRQIVLDQAEITSVRDCVLSSIHTTSAAGIWLTNGADRTPGASPGFTNRITIDGNQFSFPISSVSVANLIADDGGGNHAITNNNLSGGLLGIRAAYVAALTLENNEHENAYSGDIVLDETTLAGTYFGPVYGFSIKDCVTISPGTSGGTALGNIVVKSAVGGEIRGNTFGNYTNAAVYFPNTAALAFNTSSNIGIEHNDKVVTGSGRTVGPFVAAANGAVLKSIQNRQCAETYVAAATTTSGFPQALTPTPATMEGIRVGTRLTCGNADGTNREQVIVTAVTSTTFTATFQSQKSANWVVRAGTPMNQIRGSGSFSSSTTSTVTFAPTGEYDTNYQIRITPTSAPAGLWHVPPGSKGTANFVVTCASSGSWTYDWELVRD